MSDFDKVEGRIRQASFARIFLIGVRGVMANQAVNIRRVGKVIGRIHPSVPDVTGSALLEVGADGTAGAVDHQGQSNIDPMVIPLDLRRGFPPVPVGGFQQVIAYLRVAAQTASGNFLWTRLAFDGYQGGVVRSPGMMAQSTGRWRGTRLELALVAPETLAMIGAFQADARRVIRSVRVAMAPAAALGWILFHVVMTGGTGASQFDIHGGVQYLKVFSNAVIFGPGKAVVADSAVASNQVIMDAV
jgi:hypothetical protein